MLPYCQELVRFAHIQQLDTQQQMAAGKELEEAAVMEGIPPDHLDKKGIDAGQELDVEGIPTDQREEEVKQEDQVKAFAEAVDAAICEVINAALRKAEEDGLVAAHAYVELLAATQVVLEDAAAQAAMGVAGERRCAVHGMHGSGRAEHEAPQSNGSTLDSRPAECGSGSGRPAPGGSGGF